MRTLMRLALAAAIALGAAAPPPPAEAHACARPPHVSSAANRTIRSVNARIDALEAVLVETLKAHAAQTSGYTAQAATSIGQTLDGQTRALAQVEREAAEARLLAEHMPSAARCESVAGAAGLSATAAVAAGEAAAAGERSARRLAGPPAGAARDAAGRWRDYLANWCAPELAGGGGDACTGPPEWHGRDLLPSSLFGAPTLADGASIAAAEAWRSNVAAPVAPNPIPLAAVDTGAETELLLRHRSLAARASLAAGTLGALHALRVPAVRLQDWAGAMLPPGAERPEGPLSRQELLEFLAARRFERPEWHVGLQAMTAPDLLRESLHLQAVALTLGYERWVLEQRRAAMDAAMLAMQAERARAELAPALAATFGAAP